MPFYCRPASLNCGNIPLVLPFGEQAQVSFGDRQRRISRQRAENRNATMLLDGAAQLVLMPSPRDVIQNHPGNRRSWLELLIAKHQSRRTATHTRGADYKKYRRSERARESSGAAGALSCFVIRNRTVIEAVIAFDQGKIRGCPLDEGLQKCVGRGHEEGVERAAGAAGRSSQPGRVNVVRPLLERLHREAAARERRGQTERDGRLAAASVRRGDHQPGIRLGRGQFRQP